MFWISSSGICLNIAKFTKIYLNMFLQAAARVEDGDEPPWTQQSASSGQTVVLRAARFYRRNLQNPNPNF
jgi:hypothetical protein